MRYEDQVFSGQICQGDVMMLPAAAGAINGLKETAPVVALGEVKRVMIEKYGTTRFLKDGGAEKVHQDGHGILWRRNLANDEPIVMVEVFNPTPEPDGVYAKSEILSRFGSDLHRSMSYVHGHDSVSRYKTYFLRVQPELRPMIRGKDGRPVLGSPQKMTAHNAVASTYGMTGAEYNPEIRT